MRAYKAEGGGGVEFQQWNRLREGTLHEHRPGSQEPSTQSWAQNRLLLLITIILDSLPLFNGKDHVLESTRSTSNDVTTTSNGHIVPKVICYSPAETVSNSNNIYVRGRTARH